MFKSKRKIGMANKTSKASRVNIPSEVLQVLKAEIGDHVWFNVTDNGEVILTKADE